jgi:hypothetical protein
MGLDPSYENELTERELRAFVESNPEFECEDENVGDIVTVLHMPRHPTADEWALALEMNAGA